MGTTSLLSLSVIIPKRFFQPLFSHFLHMEALIRAGLMEEQINLCEKFCSCLVSWHKLLKYLEV